MKTPRTANTESPDTLPLRLALFTICNWEHNTLLEDQYKDKTFKL